METWTIQKLLNWVTKHFMDKGLDSPRLSAELLLSHVLGLKRIELYTQFDKVIVKEQLERLHGLVKRAARQEPIAYLTGRAEFYSLQFELTRDCLIPRPETEVLVEQAVDFLRGRQGRQFVCDLCTGCGCVAVAIAKSYADVRIVATDISEAVLKTMAKNIDRHGLSGKVELLCGDLFEPLLPYLDEEKFDLIVCNPPYVSEAEYEGLAKNVKDYEPKLALLAGADGLDVYRRIIPSARQFLKEDGGLMLETGATQAQNVCELLNKGGIFCEISVEKDALKNDRVVIAKAGTSHWRRIISSE